MTDISSVLFSKAHLFNPNGELTKPTTVSRLEQVITIVALAALGLISFGTIPAYYYFAAKKKISLYNDLEMQKGKQIPGSSLNRTPLLNQSVNTNTKNTNTNASDLNSIGPEPTDPITASNQAMSPTQNITPTDPLINLPQGTKLNLISKPDPSDKALDFPKLLDFEQSKEEFLAEKVPANVVYAHMVDPAKLPASVDNAKYTKRLDALKSVVGLFKNMIPAQFTPVVNVVETGDLKHIQSVGGAMLNPANINDPTVKKTADEGRLNLFNFLEKNKDVWIGKRVSILSNGKCLDAFIIGKKDNLANGRWTMYSNGLGELAEVAHWRIQQLEKLKTNFIFYNYPGIGYSEGLPTRNDLVAAHETILSFLEDEKNGLAAKEIIGWGTSLGGGVQGHSLKRHEFKPNIRYAIVQDETYSKLSDGASSALKNPFGGMAVKNIGWQLSSETSMKTIKHPKIIIQKAAVLNPVKPNDILDDGVFTPESTLAGHLLGSGKLENTKFIGVKQDHCKPFHQDELDEIYKAIDTALQAPITIP
jgi:hypothetical protein